jgi:hypothetical protein
MRKVYVALLVALTALCTAAVIAPSASAKELTIKALKAQLAAAQEHQKQATAVAMVSAANIEGALMLRAGLTDLTQLPEQMRDDLPARLMADGLVSDVELAALGEDLVAKERAVTSWVKKVKGLQKRIKLRLQIASWNRNHQWWPLIKIACDKYHVNASNLRHMMILESDGQHQLSGLYQGLFQYSYSTWSGSWNPWRHESIYDGWAQIQATALAISKGMGPSQWPNTYPMSF